MYKFGLALRDPLSILDDLALVQDQFNRAFDVRGRQAMGRFPILSSSTTDDGAVVEAVLPGINAKDIGVSVIDDELTVSGEIGRDEKDGACNWQERPYGKFSRTVRLPFKTNADKIKAAYKNGILRISLPRAKERQPRKIAVSSE